MAESGLNSEQKSQIFRKFGYGIVRLFSGHALRDMINRSEVENIKAVDTIHEWRHKDDSNFVEVAFNGNCKRVHYVAIGKNFHIGVIHDKETHKVKIVPKTLYKACADGSMEMIDLKKTGLWPFRSSALTYSCGGDIQEKREVLKDYLSTKLLVHSNPTMTTDQQVNNPRKCAAAMIYGTPHGKTLLSKVPNSLFNYMYFSRLPLLYFFTGHRVSPSVTTSLRKDLNRAQAQDDRDGYAQIQVLKSQLEDAQKKIKEMESEKQQSKQEDKFSKTQVIQGSQTEVNVPQNGVTVAKVEPILPDKPKQNMMS